MLGDGDSPDIGAARGETAEDMRRPHRGKQLNTGPGNIVGDKFMTMRVNNTKDI